jgi:hypothetical protein
MTHEFPAEMIGVQRNAASIVAHALQRTADVGGLRMTSRECYNADKIANMMVAENSRSVLYNYR